MAYKYLNNISKKINTFKGGLLIIDYGYLEKKMKNSLQSVRKHKFSSILKDLGNSDITYNVNFNLLKKITKKLNLKVTGITSQKNFLTKLGIREDYAIGLITDGRLDLSSVHENVTKNSAIILTKNFNKLNNNEKINMGYF